MSTPRIRRLELHLSIGGLVGHVVIADPPSAFARDVENRFAAFRLPHAPHVERAFSLHLTCLPSGRRATSPRDGEAGAERRLAVLAGSDGLTIDHWDFAAQLAPRDGDTALVGTGTTRATHFAFESLMRVLWSALLPRQGGALFHACGLHEAGRGLLAAGPSGAGKTTLARKAADEDILSDEVVAVHRGNGGGWRISATPFFGELQRGGHSPRSWPLAGLALLEKRDAIAVEPLPLGAAVQRALGCLLCFETDASAAERNFALCVALCQGVPTFVCGSRADSPLDDILDAVAPHLSVARDGATPPENTRELVTALRSNLRRHGRYAFQPRGGSMRPFLHSGDTLFVESIAESAVRAGDVVLYWRVGRTPDRDSLICHRVIGRLPGDRGTVFLAKGDSLPHVESFEHGQGAELIGRVCAISREGRAWPVPGRLGSLGILLASLAFLPLSPFLKLVPRR